MKPLCTYSLKHPLWASFSLFIFFCLIIIVPMDKVFFLIAGGSGATAQAQYLAAFLLRSIGFLLCLLLLVKLGFAEVLKFNRIGFCKCLGIIWPAFIMIAIPFPFGPIIEGAYRLDVSLLIPMLLKFISVGMIEEIFFRGAILSILLLAWHAKKNGIYKAVIVSSLIFGLVHLVNLLYLLSGQDVIIATMAQILYATFLGIFFAGIYLRTKNIWLVMLIHALIDISGELNVFVVNTAASTAVAAPMSIGDAVMQVVMLLPFALYGLFLVRKVEWENFTTLDYPETAILASNVQS